MRQASGNLDYDKQRAREEYSGGFTIGRPQGAVDGAVRSLSSLLEVIGPVTLTDNLLGARWSKLAPGLVLDWLAQQVKLAIVASSAGRENAAGLAIEESVLQRMDTRNLFCYLDIINRLRGQPGGSFNVQLTFETLLIDWASGLRECTEAPPLDGMNFVKAGR